MVLDRAPDRGALISKFRVIVPFDVVHCSRVGEKISYGLLDRLAAVRGKYTGVWSGGVCQRAKQLS